MPGVSVNIEFDNRIVVQRLGKFNDEIMKNIDRVVRLNAVTAEAYMKKNAKWTDRTGNARRGLSARVTRSRWGRKITLSHGVSYGIWLEVRWAGRYAILNPSVREITPRIMSGLRDAMR